jgi:hypothetical protein
MSEIILKRFDVRLIEWGDNKDTYECKAEFSTKGMDFTINIPHDLGDALVSICRAKIALASEGALENLRLLATEDDQLKEKGQ